MFNKIFRSGFITSLFVLIISFGMVFCVLYDYFETQVFAELVSEVDYIAYALKNEGVSYIENFENDSKRITLISVDGTVLADTDAEVSMLENHADREEFAEAVKNGEGMSSRYSDTLMEKNLYYAKKLDDEMILRISATQNSVVTILLALLQPLIIIAILALAVSLFLSHRVSKSIIQPINALDPDKPEENEVYEELAPLLRKISVQKETIDRQLKEARKKQTEFELITGNMNEGLLVTDKDCNVLSYNRAALELLGITDVKCGSVLTFNRTREFRNVVEKAMDGERAQSRITINESIYNLIVNPVCENGSVIGCVIIIIDITESAGREQLRQEFTSNVSHELKTPLTSISGFAEMMKAGGMPEDTVIDFSTCIYEEVQRLISLVSDILKISELDEGIIPAEKENVDLYELSKDIVDRLRAVADKRNIDINVIGSSVCVFGVKKIIDEMVYNLCDNAVKYNKESGVVDVIINADESNVNVTVRDTGIGIPVQEQSRVFERFYRVDKSHSKLVGGTGLGLAIVKHGASFHNAGISLESTLGKGTSITISFCR